eukprot:GSChrysophyteH1.ASY1.ANO1.2002.1 assembled CDS
MSRMSFLSKLAYLLNWKVPSHITKSRFLFYSANDHFDGVARTVEEMIEYVKRDNPVDRTLLVAFSGGAVNKIGIPRTEFRRTLQQAEYASQCDQLYVNDPTGMSFYHHEENAFSKVLRHIFGSYDRIFMIGNCMGASAVLRFVHMLPKSKPSAVLAFNPEIMPAYDWRRPSFLLASLIQPYICWNLQSEIERSIKDSKALVHIHVSSWPAEYNQAKLLLPLTDLSISLEDSSQEECRHALQEALQEASGNKQRVVLSHHSFAKHGLLSECLKPSGALKVIIDSILKDLSQM